MPIGWEAPAWPLLLSAIMFPIIRRGESKLSKYLWKGWRDDLEKSIDPGLKANSYDKSLTEDQGKKIAYEEDFIRKLNNSER